MVCDYDHGLRRYPVLKLSPDFWVGIVRGKREKQSSILTKPKECNRAFSTVHLVGIYIGWYTKHNHEKFSRKEVVEGITFKSEKTDSYGIETIECL